MGCDYFANKDGEFRIKLSCELPNGSYQDNEMFLTDLKPNGRIYTDLLEGESR